MRFTVSWFRRADGTICHRSPSSGSGTWPPAWATELQIRVAFKDGKEIASILTLQHKDVVVYKYGCSDTAFQNLGGTPILFWKTILEAKAAGLTCMDFGRSDADNPGLIAFKDRWGAKSSKLTYLRWSRKQAPDVTRRRSSGVVKQLFALMPDTVLQATGRILYRHVGERAEPRSASAIARYNRTTYLGEQMNVCMLAYAHYMNDARIKSYVRTLEGQGHG